MQEYPLSWMNLYHQCATANAGGISSRRLHGPLIHVKEETARARSIPSASGLATRNSLTASFKWLKGSGKRHRLMMDLVVIARKFNIAVA